MSQITFNDIITELAELGTKHKDVKTNYRWNFAEFDGDVRTDTVFPLMTYEGPDVQPTNSESSPILHYLGAFNILGMQDVDTSDLQDEENQDLVLHNSLEIVLEIVRKLKAFSLIPFIDDAPNVWYGVFDLLNVSITKVGPVTTSYLYGYRCEFVVKNKFSLVVDDSKWDD